MTRVSVSACLVALVVGLLLVGVVSGTPLRHVLQAAPAVAVLAARTRVRTWTPFAALAVFVFWLAIMSLIWLYLLGLARIVTGHFTRVEIALTLVIGGAAAAGLVAALRAREPSSWPARGAAFVAAAALQVGATWLSVQPAFATR
ncbi:MAG TPA: hypothetical protein VFG37_14800 [Planctomycetota bacterium]|jgi:predicted ABC-type exoprotein transport system permease subunit|nr:hypothetical protein [Planctomycetota bacterium]